MPLNLEKYNQEVSQWMRQLQSDFATTAGSMGIQHRSTSPSNGSSVAKIKGRSRLKDGAIDKVGYTFPRSLIWPHKGAGKGRAGNKGSRWIDKYGNTKKTDSKSLGKMGTSGRTAKPFINQVLDSDRGINELATIAAVNMGEAITGSLFIK